VPEWTSTDYKEIKFGIKNELTSTECLRGRLTYWEEVEHPQRGKFVVTLPKLENSRTFFSADCPYLIRYAEVLGKDFVWNNKIYVAELSYEKIDAELTKRRKDEFFSHLLTRIESGFNYAYYVLVLIAFIGFMVLATKWIISGFRKSN
jgi:hypothetical protein